MEILAAKFKKDLLDYSRAAFLNITSLEEIVL